MISPLVPESVWIARPAQSTIPGRLDRLPWSSWHLRVLIALGVTWLLDGLEGSLDGSLAGALKADHAHGGLAFTDIQLGLSSSFYLAGAVLGAVIFGFLADRFGRRYLFFWTLFLYLCATACTGLSWSLASFTVFRILTGAGIGGEYAAINSAIDELMPARLRGRIDLWINGTFWLGIILGSLVSVALLSLKLPHNVPGWRLAFLSGIPIGVSVLFMRRYIPESPRWLLTRHRRVEADLILINIERNILGTTSLWEQTPQEVSASQEAAPLSILLLLTAKYRRRVILCFALMAAQAFFL
jgi:MFS family permease